MCTAQSQYKYLGYCIPVLCVSVLVQGFFLSRSRPKVAPDFQSVRRRKPVTLGSVCPHTQRMQAGQGIPSQEEWKSSPMLAPINPDIPAIPGKLSGWHPPMARGKERGGRMVCVCVWGGGCYQRGHAGMCVGVHACTQEGHAVCIHKHEHTQVYTNTHTHTHADIPTHMHMHTHMRT